MTYDITFQELSGNRVSATTTVTADDWHTAIGAAVIKRYGRRCWFQRDAGIRTGLYGQIFRSLGTNGNTSVTDRIRIDIESEDGTERR